jgi:beta-N-acetylhexosaminidase
MPDLLGIGLTGTALTDLERRILRQSTPYAVVLFGRNIADPPQLRDLVREVKSLAAGPPPLFMIDEEGGRVDRLRHLLPGLPSAEAFGEGERAAEMSAWSGRVIGMALRWFDVEVDLAPVVDIRGAESSKGLERRTFGADAETVIELAGAFMRGLQDAGVAACLKHFPGIGTGSADPHYGATIIDLSLDELIRRDLVPFMRLGNEAKAIMIGHGTYPRIDEPDVPASLSHRITTNILRGEVGFDGLAVSDDMEMHAVSDLGSYESIHDRALMAGNDVILFCSHIERVPDLQAHIGETASRDAAYAARMAEASAHANAFRAYVDQIRRDVPPAPTFDDVIDEAARFVDELEATRPAHDAYALDDDRRKSPRHPKAGRTGREEWT